MKKAGRLKNYRLPRRIASSKSPRLPLERYTVPDRQAVGAVRDFLDEQKLLVEPACGAGLAFAYEPATIEARCSDEPPRRKTSFLFFLPAWRDPSEKIRIHCFF